MNAPETYTTEQLTGSVAEIYEEPTSEPQTTPEPTPEPSPEPSAEPAPAGEQPPAGQPTFPTPEQITASVREGLRQSQPPAATQERQYSPEELDRLFNVWQPGADFLQRVLAGGEDGLKALLELRDGLSKQFGTLLQYQLELARRDLVSQMDPALKYVTEAAAKADREDFFSQHEDLRPYEMLTQTVFNALKAEGYQAPDKATAFKTLADRTRALLPTAGNGSAPAPSSGGRTTTSPTAKRPASLSSGSQAGGGGGSAPQAPFAGGEIFL